MQHEYKRRIKVVSLTLVASLSSGYYLDGDCLYKDK